MAKDFFVDLLGTIEAEQDRQAILATMTKTEEGKKVFQRINVLAENGENYIAWHKDEKNGWPVYKAAHEKLAEVTKQVETLTQERDALKAGKAPGATPPANDTPLQEEFDMESMTHDQFNKALDDRIKAMGFVTKAEADAIADAKAREAAAGLSTRVYGHALPLVEAKLAAKRQYEQDFPGKRFDDAGFDKFIADNPNKFGTMGDAVAAFTRTDYENKTKADAFEQGRLAGEKTATEKLQKEHADAHEIRIRSLEDKGKFTVGYVGKFVLSVVGLVLTTLLIATAIHNW